MKYIIIFIIYPILTFSIALFMIFSEHEFCKEDHYGEKTCVRKCKFINGEIKCAKWEKLK